MNKKPTRKPSPVEREVRLMRKQFDTVLALKADTATLAAEVRRLLRENDALRTNRALVVAEMDAMKLAKATA